MRDDLEAIDRELDKLGQPRGDVAELVARYAARGPSDEGFDGLHGSAPSPARSIAPSALHAGSAALQADTFAARRAAPVWSRGADVPTAEGLELSEDHDEFELLVEDEELVDDEQLEPV